MKKLLKACFAVLTVFAALTALAFLIGDKDDSEIKRNIEE